MPKASANYAKLANDTDILREGLTARVERTERELNRLLKDHPERVKVMQLVEHYAANRGALIETEERLERYQRLIAEATDGSKPPAKS